MLLQPAVAELALPYDFLSQKLKVKTKNLNFKLLGFAF
jgi:hypothetical protein